MENRFWFGDTPKEGIFTFPFHHFSEEKLSPKASYASLYWGMVFAFLFSLYLFFSLFQNTAPAHKQVNTFTQNVSEQNFEKAVTLLSPKLQERVSSVVLNQSFSELNLTETSGIKFLSTQTNGKQINLQGTLIHNNQEEQPVSFTLSKYKNQWLIDEILIGQDPFSDNRLPELFFRP